MAKSKPIESKNLINISKKRVDDLLGVHKSFHNNCKYLANRQAKRIEREHAGKVLVIVNKKIINSFEPDEFDENFKLLEDKFGKDTLRSACVTYIPKRNEVLML